MRRKRRRRLLAVVAVVTFFGTLFMTALAQQLVGTVDISTEIVEPISFKPASFSGTLFPGEHRLHSVEICNAASITYGLLVGSTTTPEGLIVRHDDAFTIGAERCVMLDVLVKTPRDAPAPASYRTVVSISRAGE